MGRRMKWVGRLMMLGVRSAQRGLLEADHLYLDYVGISGNWWNTPWVTP